MEGVYKDVVMAHLAQAVGKPSTTYEAVVIVDGMSLKVIKVHSLTRHCDYVESCFETLFLTLAMKTSDANLTVSTGSGNVKVQLITFIGGRASRPINLVGIANITSDSNVKSTTMNTAVGDSQSMAVVTFELLSYVAWNTRVYQFGGIYLKAEPLSIARYLLTKSSLADILPVDDAAPCVEYVKEPQRSYHSITVPDGTPFLGVFDYLQNHYGIYSCGLGVYLFKQSWFLFRPWDAKKFSEDSERLVIYNIPEEKMSNADKTYSQSGKTITIACTGEVSHLDDRNITALNQGTGYRMGSIRALDLRVSTLSEDGLTTETAPNDFMSQSNPTPHRSGLTNAPIISARFKDDEKAIQSQFVRNGGSIVKARWENSVSGVLRPGMGVKFNFPVGDKVIARYGTLIGEVFHDTVANGSLASDSYHSVSELTIWLAH
jgi:hypothetical protein